MRYHAKLEFDGFGFSNLCAEAQRQGVSMDELLVHAAMYYLADRDSGRTAHRVLPFQDEELAALPSHWAD
jgi:hypothetical protein